MGPVQLQQQVDPAVVLVHGLHYNCADQIQRESQTCISHEDFKSAAAGALKAQFRSSIIRGILSFPLSLPRYA